MKKIKTTLDFAKQILSSMETVQRSTFLTPSWVHSKQ